MRSDYSVSPWIFTCALAQDTTKDSKSIALAARHFEIKALVLLLGSASEAAKAYIASAARLGLFGAANEGDARQNESRFGEVVPGLPIDALLMEEQCCRPNGGLINDRRLSS